MLTRRQRAALVFVSPLRLAGEPRPRPAGTYLVETGEELIEGLSFPAYRRTGAKITLRSARPGGLVQALGVDPADLARAHATDRA